MKQRNHVDAIILGFGGNFVLNLRFPYLQGGFVGYPVEILGAYWILFWLLPEIGYFNVGKHEVATETYMFLHG